MTSLQLHLFPKREWNSAAPDYPPGGIEYVFDLYLGLGGVPANDGRTSILLNPADGLTPDMQFGSEVNQRF